MKRLAWHKGRCWRLRRQWRRVGRRLYCLAGGAPCRPQSEKFFPALTRPFGPFPEIVKFVFHRAVWRWWELAIVAGGILAGVCLPWGVSRIWSDLWTLHLTLLGFSFAVFGYTILGGKDDFFGPLLQTARGFSKLRALIPALFLPIPLHALAAGALLVRRLYPGFWEAHHSAAVCIRVIYAFFAALAVIQTLVAASRLSYLATVRLAWKHGQETGRRVR